MSLKKTLFIFAVAFFGLLSFGMQAKPAKAAIVQIEIATTTFPNAAGGTATTTFQNPTTAGQLVLVLVDTVANNVTTTITDNLGDTYVSLYSISSNAFAYGGAEMQMYYLANAPAGVTSVGVKQGIAFNGSVTAAHFAGVATSNPLDTWTSPSSTLSTSTSWSSNPITTTNANDLLVGDVIGLWDGSNCNASPSGAWVSGNEFLNGVWDGANGSTELYSYQIVSSVQTNIEDTGTDSGTCQHFSSIAAFKAASTAPPPSTEYWFNGIISLIGNFIFH